MMDIYEYYNGCEILLPKKEKKRKEKKSKAGLYINSLKVLNLSECVGPQSQQALTFRALML
jgi:hypothetical protein